MIDAHISQNEIAGNGLPPDDNPSTHRWDQAAATIFNLSGRFYECPNCDRIMWQRPGREIVIELWKSLQAADLKSIMNQSWQEGYGA